MPGSVNFAGWVFSWSIPQLSGEGLVITKASFNGTFVPYRGGTPFVLVPYHGNWPTFKDGLGATCGGLPLTALVPTVPNANSAGTAGNDNQYDPNTNPTGSVMIEKLPGDLLEPARVVIWAKLQCGNYQYVHRWTFSADGAIDVQVGLGGKLLSPDGGGRAHVHNFYFRLDLDLGGSANNLVQRSEHQGWNPGQDQWVPITKEAKQSWTPSTFTTWRIVNKAPKANGKLRGYELVPGSDGAPDGTYSTGDLWVVRYKSGAEDGANVLCNDGVLGAQYVSGESVDGEDVVVWHCLRHHHYPRDQGEEKQVLPYEFLGFHLEPRDFLDDTPSNLYPTTPPSP